MTIVSNIFDIPWEGTVIYPFKILLITNKIPIYLLMTASSYILEQYTWRNTTQGYGKMIASFKVRKRGNRYMSYSVIIKRMLDYNNPEEPGEPKSS